MWLYCSVVYCTVLTQILTEFGQKVEKRTSVEFDF